MEKIITVENILDILMRRLWLIVALIILGGTISYSYSEYILPKKYTSSVTLYVYNQAENRTQLNASDFALSLKLVDTYMVILRSDQVMERVSERIAQQGLDYSSSQILSMISSEAVEGTEVFKISVTSSSKEDAKIIADAIAEIAPNEIIRVVKAGAVEIVDYAKLPTAPSSPNVSKNTIIGVLLGFILAAAFAILLELMNTTVKGKDDLVQTYKIPVLAVIPNLEGKTKPTYSYKNHGRKDYSNYYTQAKNDDSKKNS